MNDQVFYQVGRNQRQLSAVITEHGYQDTPCSDIGAVGK